MPYPCAQRTCAWDYPGAYDALRGRDSVSAAEIADKGIDNKGVGRRSLPGSSCGAIDQMALKGTIERIGSGSGVRWRMAGG